VIDAATNAIVATITIPPASAGISITPDGAKLYAIGSDANNVTVVDTATNVATAVVPVGTFPISVGNFIQPAARFAGAPGKANCHGQSVSALARQYGGLNSAASALGYTDVSALQNAILTFCAG
jgi:YVTN family beta-propeller protein